MKEESARINILPSLRSTGLIDEDGKPTDRAVKWRDDAQYKQVCDDIRKGVYPQELLDLASDSSADRDMIKSWFANHLQVGENASQKLSAFYFMLLEGTVRA